VPRSKSVVCGVLVTRFTYSLYLLTSRAKLHTGEPPLTAARQTKSSSLVVFLLFQVERVRDDALSWPLRVRLGANRRYWFFPARPISGKKVGNYYSVIEIHAPRAFFSSAVVCHHLTLLLLAAIGKCVVFLIERKLANQAFCKVSWYHMTDFCNLFKDNLS